MGLKRLNASDFLFFLSSFPSSENGSSETSPPEKFLNVGSNASCTQVVIIYIISEIEIVLFRTSLQPTADYSIILKK
jgi:hypothetical protein